MKAEYPSAFINSVPREFNNKQNHSVDEDEYIIPLKLFEIPKKTIMFEFPYCPEKRSRQNGSFQNFTNLRKTSFKQLLNGSQRKSRTYSHLKIRIHILPVKFTRENVFAGKLTSVKQSATLKQDGMSTKTSKKTSEPSKHLSENPEHMFEWKCLLNASSNSRQRKNLEASFIAVLGPSLNNQLDTKKFIS